MSRRWLSIELRVASAQNSMSAPVSSPRSVASARAMSARVSACDRERRADVSRCPSPSTSASRRLAASTASASSSWRHVTVCVRRPSRSRPASSRVSSSASAIPARRRASVSGMSRPFPARIGESDQVPGQVAAVDGGDVVRIERAQIPRVVPVVEMAAEAREAGSWWPASPPTARPPRSFPSIRSRGRSPPTGDRGRDWSARSDARAPAPGPPGNCPAAAC